MLRNLTTDEISFVAGGWTSPDEYDPNNPGNIPQFQNPFYSLNGTNSLGETLVDENNDGYWDNADIVVVGGLDATDYIFTYNYNVGPNNTMSNTDMFREWNRHVDIGIGFAWMVGGLRTSENGQIGIFIGLGKPGVVLGGGTTAGDLQAGWEAGATEVAYHSGALPIAGYDIIVLDPRTNEYVTAAKVGNQYYLPEIDASGYEIRNSSGEVVPALGEDGLLIPIPD